MTLWNQALRSIWRGKKSYLACVVLIGVGVAVYVSFQLLFLNLTTAMEGLYQGKRFGDGFAKVSMLPLSQVEGLRAIEGIRRLDATLVADARVQREDSHRLITLRVSSFAPEDAGRLNDFVLVKGTLPGEGGILVGEAFALANGLAIGDSVPLLYGGQELCPVITGLVQSPEYVYAISESGLLMPDNEAFGFAYMTARALGSLTGYTGHATNLSFLLEEGVSYLQVKPLLEDALAPYGLLALYARADQPSHAMLQMEIDAIGAMSTSLPMLFIGIAVVILYIMLKRTVEQERSQIGILKAFGLSDRAILAHYLLYGGVPGLAGGLLGVGLGVLMTGSLTQVFLEFFSLPAMKAPPAPRFLAAGLAISLLAGLAGALMGTWGILRLRPSEAMRPPSPPAVTRDILGKIPGVHRLLTSLGFMALRNISRNKFRSAFVLIGLSLSFAITAFMASYGEMFDKILLNQFTKVELYNLRINLTEPVSYTAGKEAAYALEGVRRGEVLLELPVELRHNHLKKSASMIGLEESAALYQIYDNGREAAIPPPVGGMALSSSLAEDLQVKRGDLLAVTTPYTGEEEYFLPVLEVIDSNLGGAAYMALGSLWQALELSPAVTGLLLDTAEGEAIKESLLESRQIASMVDQEQAKQVYVDMLDSYAFLIDSMQAAGVVIAFAIITNTAAISLSERKREYSTMRVLGLEPREIGTVVSFEYLVLTLVSIPPGILLTRLMKQAMGGMVDNNMFSMPVQTAPSSFVSAALLCMAAVALAGWSARRKIARFDMVEVLKERE